MNRFFFKVFYAITLVVLLFNMGFWIADAYKADIDDLPEGKLLFSSVSPDGVTELRVYVIDCEIGTAVRAECVNRPLDVKRNVYWNTGIITANVSWFGAYEVNINGIFLDVIDGDVYDCRAGGSIFLAGSAKD